jgi:hypothetical protein
MYSEKYSASAQRVLGDSSQEHTAPRSRLSLGDSSQDTPPMTLFPEHSSQDTLPGTLFLCADFSWE